jgi:hypothetical protein
VTNNTASDPVLVGPNGRRRARGFGLIIPGVPGLFNAITDVPGVAVGFTTRIEDDPVTIRTGVTAILPREQCDHHAIPSEQRASCGGEEAIGVGFFHERQSRPHEGLHCHQAIEAR